MTAINVGRNASVVVEAPSQSPYTGVKIFAGQDDEGADLFFFAGNENGSVLEIDNPWATQVMADNILTSIQGYSYKAMEADGTLLDPAAELGDAVTVNKVYTVLARNDTKYGALAVSTISAPNDGELGHEYPYVDNTEKRIERQISKAAASLNVEIDSIKAQVTDDDGNYTVLNLQSDGLYVGGSSTKLDGKFIGDETIGSTQLVDGSVGTDQLANLSITGTKIANGAIATNQLAAGAVTAAKIKANCITASEIAANAITASELSSGAVTTDKLSAKAVTAAKIDTEAITTAKLLLTGMVNFYNSTSKTASATLGYGSGTDGSGNTTYGAKMVATGGSNYIIVTNAGARMTAGSGYIYTANNTCHCSTAFVADSDARIKENVDDDMTKYKEALLNLRPVSFNYIPERGMGDTRYTGLIAQEAEEVMDEFDLEKWALASVNGEGIHGVCYEQLVPVLVSCVQDLMREVNELKERLNG